MLRLLLNPPLAQEHLLVESEGTKMQYDWCMTHLEKRAYKPNLKPLQLWFCNEDGGENPTSCIQKNHRCHHKLHQPQPISASFSLQWLIFFLKLKKKKQKSTDFTRRKFLALKTLPHFTYHPATELGILNWLINIASEPRH